MVDGFGDPGGSQRRAGAGAEQKVLFENPDLGGGKAEALPVGGQRGAAGVVEGDGLDIQHEGRGAAKERFPGNPGPGQGDIFEDIPPAGEFDDVVKEGAGPGGHESGEIAGGVAEGDQDGDGFAPGKGGQPGIEFAQQPAAAFFGIQPGGEPGDGGADIG